MFDSSTKTPRLFGISPGTDFPAALVNGLMARTAGQPPESLARIRLIVNTRRMARRVRDLFDSGPALLLPKIQLVTDLGALENIAKIPPPVPKLRRRLELIQLVSTLLDSQPDLAARSSLYDLVDSLAALMEEMEGEGVSPDSVMSLDVTDLSGHWQRAKSFLKIVQHYFGDTATDLDAEARQRLVILGQIAEWQDSPPTDPIILAGSTGSRGSTHILMQAIARLSQGAVILPGIDFDMPARVWSEMDNALLAEDHPQFRFRKLMTALDLTRSDIADWSDLPAPNPARNRVLSLALRPAPVTDQWLTEGPELRDIDTAFANVTLVEAPSARQEALSIAMRLRQAAETGQTAALITPDRMLTRQVSAALDRWNIIADDSAGLPLQLSAVGRFLRHVSALGQQKLTADALITLLKHPLSHSGQDRGDHLLFTRELELHLRRHGPPFPTPETLQGWLEKQTQPHTAAWVDWLCACFINQQSSGDLPLLTRVQNHITLAERIAQGIGDGSGELWNEAPGRTTREIVDELVAEAPVAGNISAADYHDLFGAILSRGEVRNPDAPHPLIRIWGTLEARVQGADLLILGGLNEGSWPETPKPDPWLNRKMRHDAGLLLPERRIGLSAHDFQQAAAAPEVWFTRSIRTDDAETVPSRWLNRLANLLDGLPDQGGRETLAQMRARGAEWLARAKLFEQPVAADPAMRPAPCPPAIARPKRLSVTEIKTLVRDPYAIYAKHVLRLRPLNSLMHAPDALLRGTVLHKVFESFVASTVQDPANLTRENFLAITDHVLASEVAWPDMRLMWRARILRVADWFLAQEAERQQTATPIAFEVKGTAQLPDLGFTLSGTADRIDQDPTGSLHIYDYKTGTLPTPAQQKHFDKQLLLEAAIAELSGFDNFGPKPVSRATYIGVGSKPEEKDAPLADEPIGKIWSEFHELITRFSDPHQPFVPRRMMHKKDDISDYDQLSRFGEWNVTDTATPEELT